MKKLIMIILLLVPVFVFGIEVTNVVKYHRMVTMKIDGNEYVAFSDKDYKTLKALTLEDSKTIASLKKALKESTLLLRKYDSLINQKGEINKLEERVSIAYKKVIPDNKLALKQAEATAKTAEALVNISKAQSKSEGGIYKILTYILSIILTVLTIITAWFQMKKAKREQEQVQRAE